MEPSIVIGSMTWIAFANIFGTLAIGIFVAVMIWQQAVTARKAHELQELKAADDKEMAERMFELEATRARHNEEMDQKKRNHELFDKRFPVYELTRQLMSAPAHEGKIQGELYEKFRTVKLDAAFLFDKEMDEYLGEVHRMAIKAMSVDPTLDHGADGNLKAIDDRASALTWLDDELQSGKLKDTFMPYMKLS